MVALSDLLRVLRSSGGVFLEARFRAPWCVLSQVTPDDCGPGVGASGSIVAFHYVLEGEVQVRVSQSAAHSVGSGGVLLLARNDSHVLGSDLTLPPVDAESLVRRASEHELAQIEYGSGPAMVGHFVCGYLSTPVCAHPLLEALPVLLVTDLSERASAA